MIQEKVSVPDGVSVSYEDGTVTVKGPEGETRKNLRNPLVNVEVKSGEVTISSERETKRQKKSLGTFRAHIRNMIQGVQEPYVYKLKVCSSHFPMNIQVQNNEFVLKNFYGERVPRKIKLKNNVDVKVKGDIIEVTSADKEVAGQTAASIEQMTRRPNYDTRIFQDGIYITEKAGKEI